MVMSVPGSNKAPIVIGAATLERGTGRNLAESALEKASNWTVVCDIVGGVFDTTSSNTGITERALIQIECLQG